MNAEQGVLFSSHSSLRPFLSRSSWALLLRALQSHTGTLLSIQSYVDCGSREVGRKLGRWNATCLVSLLKTLLFLLLHKLPTKSSPARSVRPASESKPEPTSPERYAWKHNTKTGEIRQKAVAGKTCLFILSKLYFSSLSFFRHSVCVVRVVWDAGTWASHNVS